MKVRGKRQRCERGKGSGREDREREAIRNKKE
jgi:hypothetical protein